MPVQGGGLRRRPGHAGQFVCLLLGFGPPAAPGVHGEQQAPGGGHLELYEALVRAQRGVCRHRAYAFVVTARSLGLPARFVANEAHAFVEVWLPGRSAGWLRIDLGGGAAGLRVLGGGDRTRHVPSVPDPFARPGPFADSYSREALEPGGAPHPNVTGLPPTLAERRASRQPAVSPREAPPAPAPTDTVAPRRAAPHLVATRTGLRVTEAVVFRGDPVHVTGRVTNAAGHGLAGLVVRFLLQGGGGEGDATVVGALTTAADGTFRGRLPVPVGQPPGDYRLVAACMGDHRYAPSRSDVGVSFP
jgi:hypothetical protein